MCHIFIGDPEKELRYWPAVNNVDSRLLDVGSQYSLENFPPFTRLLDATQNSGLEGTEDGPMPCAVCLRRPAARSASFHSIPIVPEDEEDANVVKYYKTMFRHYSEVGAFQGKPFADTWALFEDLRSSMAQMAALYIPVCDQNACIKKTTAMHQKSIQKTTANDGQPLQPVLTMTQFWI